MSYIPWVCMHEIIRINFIHHTEKWRTKYRWHTKFHNQLRRMIGCYENICSLKLNQSFPLHIKNIIFFFKSEKNKIATPILLEFPDNRQNSEITDIVTKLIRVGMFLKFLNNCHIPDIVTKLIRSWYVLEINMTTYVEQSDPFLFSQNVVILHCKLAL